MQSAVLLSALALLLLVLPPPGVVVAETEAEAAETDADAEAEVAASEAVAKEKTCPIVKTDAGKLRGVPVKRVADDGANTTYCHYLGIPYAQPPTGTLRFQDPVAITPWTGIKNATAFGPPCMQKSQVAPSATGAEDCLFINVYTTLEALLNTSVKGPVIFYVHGGDYAVGNGNMATNRPDSLVNKGSVWASGNFRLGPLGFLSTGDSRAPGNAGLKDQLLMLQWIQTNIEQFGGNCNDVTIFGESSGGASAQFHALSPLSEGLFQNVIAVSGTALSPWAFETSPHENALGMRHQFDSSCAQFDADNIIGCLQNVSATDIVNKYFNIAHKKGKYGIYKNPFLPVADGTFLEDDPYTLLSNGYCNPVNFLAGATSADGLVSYYLFNLTKDARWSEVNENFTEIFKYEMPPGLRENTEAAEAVKSFYFGEKNISNGASDVEIQKAMVQMLTDLHFAFGAFQAVQLMTACGASSYLYNNTWDGLPITKTSLGLTGFDGVMHGDDMYFLFDGVGADGKLRDVPAAQLPYRTRLISLFSNFAKCGNPTPDGSNLTTWPAYSDEEVFMEIGQNLTLHCGGDERTNFLFELISTYQT